MAVNIPSITQCLALMDRYAMLANIREHSFIVARVAETIVKALQLPENEGSASPDLDLVMAGALLHDIAKTKCLDGSCNHAEEGMLICAEHDYPEVATIVGQHVSLNSFNADDYRRGCFPAPNDQCRAHAIVPRETVRPDLPCAPGQYRNGPERVAAIWSAAAKYPGTVQSPP